MKTKYREREWVVVGIRAGDSKVAYIALCSTNEEPAPGAKDWYMIRKGSDARVDLKRSSHKIEVYVRQLGDA